jgi:hypothetical protein
MTRTAYLDGTNAALRVVLDGPSLVVAASGTGPQRLPFARLRRVVVRGEVAFDGRAVPALLRAGVSLTFVDRDGGPVGHGLPCVPCRCDLAGLLDEAAILAEWPDLLDAWRTGEERRGLARLASRLALRPGGWRAAALDRHLSGWLSVRCGPQPLVPPAQLLARLEGLLRAELSAALARHGLGARFQDRRAPELDLLAAMAGLMRWELWPTALGLAAYLRDHPAKHRTEVAVMRRLARWLDADAEGRARRLAGLLASLRRRLLEIVP